MTTKSFDSFLTLKRGTICRLNIPPARPIKLLSGVLHEAGADYRFLGTYSCSFVRLSRIGDNAKIMVIPADVIVFPSC